MMDMKIADLHCDTLLVLRMTGRNLDEIDAHINVEKLHHRHSGANEKSCTQSGKVLFFHRAEKTDGQKNKNIEKLGHKAVVASRADETLAAVGRENP